MKNLLITTACMISLQLMAQNPSPNERMERVESLRIAYISQKLGLTVAESQKFWPVYNEMTSEMRSLRAQRKSDDTPSAMEQLEFEQKKIDIKKKYISSFQQIIGKERLDRLYGLEEEFRKKLMELRQERNKAAGFRPGGSNGPPAGRP